MPGTTDIGNHADDEVTTIALPFPYSFYDQTYNSVNLSSNGNAQFTTTDNLWVNNCLPWLTHDYTIFPYWDDQLTNGAGEGIFTSVSGSAPDRIFNIEWRTHYFNGSGTANHELRLYEGQSRFDVIYGTVSQGNTGATAGVQRDDTTFDHTSATGRVNRLLAGKAISCKPALRRRRQRLAQLQQLRPLPRPQRLPRPHRLRQQHPGQHPRRGLVRLRRPDRKVC